MTTINYSVTRATKIRQLKFRRIVIAGMKETIFWTKVGMYDAFIMDVADRLCSLVAPLKSNLHTD